MRNYMICVGGSGARVLRATVHMAACGMIPVDDLEVVIIDPDKDTKTTSLAVQELKDYQNLKKIYSGNKILNTAIHHFEQNTTDSYIISPISDEIRTLKDVCGIEQEMEEVMHWFFKEEELDQDLRKGFYARPAIGAVFFSNFNNEEFVRLLDEIIDSLGSQEPVNILLAGSVFGGTGASGVPTILKLLAGRLEEEYAKGKNLTQYLHTGSVFILPYFSAKEAVNAAKTTDEISIRVGDFSGNTKEALRYYDVEGYFGKFTPDNFRKLQNIYLVGQAEMDEVNKYAVGSVEQKNKAHLVELYAALAAGDFFARLKNAADDKERQGIYVYARSDKMTWKDFPVPYGMKSPSAKQNMAMFLRFCMVFLLYIYQEVYDPINHGIYEPDKYLKKHPINREEWYFRLINSTDDDFKVSMNTVYTYCVDYLNWFFEVHAERNENNKNANSDKLILNTEKMALVEPEFYNLHKILFPEKYAGLDNKMRERFLKQLKTVFGEIITEEEKHYSMTAIISALNNCRKCPEDAVTYLIDNILDVLEGIK